MEELYNDDRTLLTGSGGDGEGDLTPFPEPVVAAYHQHQPTALIAPAAAPPQKLRPIRNVTFEAQGNSNSSRINAELGFQPRNLPNGCLPFESDDDLSALPLLKLKSQMDATFISSIESQISQLPSSFRPYDSGSVLCGPPFRTDFAVKDIIEHWISILASVGKVRITALEKILQQKQRAQQEMHKYLSLKQTHKDSNMTDYQKKFILLFKVMSRFL